MKRFAVILLVVFGVFSITAAAQSGRRKTEASPTPGVSVTNSISKTDSANDDSSGVGYSESAPNSPRSIYALPNSRPKLKKQKDNSEPKQTAQTASQIPQQPTLQTTGGDEDDVVKVETNLITIPVSVYDRNGIYIPSLRQQDFKVFEDGKEQEVAYFGTSDKPFTVILLIDVSPSTAYKIEQIQDAATAFVDQLKPLDNVMVIEFDESVHVLAEATNDRQKIYKAIRKADFGNGTALYDAVHYSLQKQLSKIEGRKAIVLFTDGVDTFSHKAEFESTIAEAEESESLIFPIYYNTYLDSRGIGSGGVMSAPPTLGLPGGGIFGGGMGQQPSSADYARGRAYLEQLAGATGGRVFRPESTPGGLTAAFEGIAEELRRQYNIGYYPPEAGAVGQRKQIKVRVNRPKLVVRARDSYIVTK